MTRIVGTYEKLAVEQVSLFNPFLMQSKDGRNKKVWKLANLTYEITLRNLSQQTIYYQTKRAVHSMAGKTVEGEHRISNAINLLPPMSIQKLMLQTLSDIPIANGMQGLIDIEILYGEEKDALNYLLQYECTPQLSISIHQNGSAQIALSSPITKNTHEKIK